MFTWSFLLVILMCIYLPNLANDKKKKMVSTIVDLMIIFGSNNFLLVSSLGSLWHFSPNCLSVSLWQHPTTIHSFPIVFFNKTCKSKLGDLDRQCKRKDHGQAMFSNGNPRKCVTVNSLIVFTDVFKCLKHVWHLALVQSLPLLL